MVAIEFIFIITFMLFYKVNSINLNKKVNVAIVKNNELSEELQKESQSLKEEKEKSLELKNEVEELKIQTGNLNFELKLNTIRGILGGITINRENKSCYINYNSFIKNNNRDRILEVLKELPSDEKLCFEYIYEGEKDYLIYLNSDIKAITTEQIKKDFEQNLKEIEESKRKKREQSIYYKNPELKSIMKEYINFYDKVYKELLSKTFNKDYYFSISKVEELQPTAVDKKEKLINLKDKYNDNLGIDKMIKVYEEMIDVMTWIRAWDKEHIPSYKEDWETNILEHTHNSIRYMNEFSELEGIL